MRTLSTSHSTGRPLSTWLFFSRIEFGAADARTPSLARACSYRSMYGRLMCDDMPRTKQFVQRGASPAGACPAAFAAASAASSAFRSDRYSSSDSTCQKSGAPALVMTTRQRQCVLAAKAVGTQGKGSVS